MHFPAEDQEYALPSCFNSHTHSKGSFPGLFGSHFFFFLHLSVCVCV